MTLVFGIGNPLRGDDALGAAVVGRLGAVEGVRAIAVHQLLPEHAAELAQAETVIFVDAAVDLPPGAIRVVRLDAEDDGPPEFGHGLEPQGLLALARALAGAVDHGAAWCVTVGAQSFELLAPLSPPVEAALDEVVRRVVDLS